ncbi:uncharacterized protein [Primulina huaijiensis]|uniref:uncharacterized protein isoform X3 n=1 Tax=Primulina huaijiensis TaxID=1492673 RepID=UPI003CC6E5E1
MVEAAEVNVIIAVSLGIWLGIASTESVAGMIAVVITAGGMGIWRGSVQVLAVADVEIVELVLPVVSRGIWRGTVRVVEAIVVVVVVVLGGLEAEAAGSAEGSASTAGSLDILLGNARNRLADDLCMAFPHSHSPHSGWDKFHGLTKINTRAQLHSINIQRNYSSKLVGTLESKCSEPEDFYVVSSESTSPVTQNWGDIYGVPWLLLVLSSLYWINQRWECNAHLNCKSVKWLKFQSPARDRSRMRCSRGHLQVQGIRTFANNKKERTTLSRCFQL